MVRNSSDVHRSFHSNTDPQHFQHQSPHISNLVCYTQLGFTVCVPSTYKIGELISLHFSSPNVKSPYETSALSSSAKVPSSSLKPVSTSVANETNINAIGNRIRQNLVLLDTKTSLGLRSPADSTLLHCCLQTSNLSV